MVLQCKKESPSSSNDVTMETKDLLEEEKSGIKCEHCPKIFQTVRDHKIHSRVHTADSECRKEKQSRDEAVDSKRHKMQNKEGAACHSPRSKKSKTGKNAPGCDTIEKVDGKFKCPYCQNMLSRKDHVLRHIRNLHVKTHHSCPVCHKKFTSIEDLDNHKEVHNKDRTFSCLDCDKSFTTSKSLRRHERIAHMEQETIYNCDDCSEQFSRSCSLKVHVLRKHKGMKFICWPCSEGFLSKEELSGHEKKCHAR